MAASFTVKVKNNNDFPLEDRYDGIIYVMPARGSVNMHSEAARHIFGVPFVDAEGQAVINRSQIFNHIQRRWGGNRTKREDGRNFKDIFDNIEFKLVAMKLVEEILQEAGEDLDEAPSYAETLAATRRRKQPKMPDEIFEAEADPKGSVA